jgi:hypothetical protein
LVLLGFVIAGLLRRRADIALIAAGGFLYSVTYFVLINASTFRYACFTVFVSVILGARVIAEWLSRRFARTPARMPSGPVLIGMNVIVLLCAGLAVRAAQQQSAAQPIQALPFQNAGFESGVLSPWNSFQSVVANVGTALVHTGQFSLAETAGPGSVYEDITGLRPGRSYTVSAWVAASGQSTAAAYIAVWNADASLATFSSPVRPDPSWQLTSHGFTAGRSGVIRVHLFRDGGSGIIYCDDVRVVPQ